MPFIGIQAGEEVWPDEVADTAPVDCPSCGEPMHVRSSHMTVEDVFRPRHFVHNPDHQHCPGGESDEHKRMKYVTHQHLSEVYDHADVGREVEIGDRRADVVAEFHEPVHPIGRGVAAETQYKNTSKDIEQVTRDYLQAGFSVVWLRENHFTDNFSVQLPEITYAWPNAVPEVDRWSPCTGCELLDEIDPAAPTIDVPFPPEFARSHVDDLRSYWELGAGELEYDLIRELSENNARRPCAACGERAEFYCYKKGGISEYRCATHTGMGVGESSDTTTQQESPANPADRR